MTPAEITLQPFKPEDQAAVKALILAGMAEHWGFIDPTLNPDLNNIAQSYAGAHFLVAWQQGAVVGCGALAPRGGGTAEIVRMSVAAHLRRQGLGAMILNHLIQQARASSIQQIVLETTETWSEVVAFYLRHGFRITHHKDGDVYFALDLN